ncbi:MAG: adenylate/guanylate cyclase domain-containing protein [Turneriella sp.]
MRQSLSFFPPAITPDLYFWDMLPYAVPGLLTFVVGMVLGIISLVRATRRERFGYYVSFGVTCIAFGALGLVISLRALIQDTTTLLRWNTYIYPFVVLLSPASTHLINYILDKKFQRAVAFAATLNWLFTLSALFSIFTGRAFTGDFLQYSFGKFPVAALPLKLWGAGSALTFITIGLPLFYLYKKRNSFAGKHLLFFGHSLLLILTISNLPSFAGFPLFPGATFSFIPMCIMAYGVFNSDFRNLKDFFFEKNALFYILNVIAGVVLLSLTYVILFRFSPAHYETLNWPWLLIPVGSIFFVVALAILIGGTNPTNPLNQYGAFSLYIFGFLLLSVIIGGLSLKPLMAHRIEQLCYMVFGLAPSVQLRFAYLSLNRPAPKFRRVLDILSLALCIMAMTPWLFTGYFEYPWGRISQAGPVIQVFGVVGFLAIAIVLRDWWKSRNRANPNRLGDISVLYLATGGLMTLGNLPATMGIEFYPIGNLTIIPTLIMTYAILKHGGKTLKTESLRISALLLPFAFATVGGFLYFVWYALPENASTSSRILHLILAGVPLTLFAFLATFVLIRPVAAKIDITLNNLQVEKDRALHSKRETERQKDETEKLNRLLKSLNEEIDLKVIMGKVQDYVAESFGVDWHALYGVTSDKHHLQMLSLHVDGAVPEADRKAVEKMQMPLGAAKGAHAHVIRTMKAFYVPNTKSRRILEASSAEEYAILQRYDLNSFLLLPLVLNNEPVGILDFSSSKGKINLSRDDISRLSILAEQITGIIYGSRLFKQVQEEREKSEKLLLNILPKDVAIELKEKGFAEPVQFDAVSVLFTDFQGFTKIAEFLSPSELIKELDACFVQFDKITERHRLEKLKTIGDSYMCAGGIPKPSDTHAIDCVLAAIEIRNFMAQMQEIKKSLGEPYWELRIGIHSGPLIAGVIGEKKFAYDVWGDTVNTASRMESSGSPGKVNISGTTYELIKEFFRCEYRGKVGAKNKGEVDMYYVIGLKPEYALDSEGRVPNGKFWSAVMLPGALTA